MQEVWAELLPFYHYTNYNSLISGNLRDLGLQKGRRLLKRTPNAISLSYVREIILENIFFCRNMLFSYFVPEITFFRL